MPNPTDGSVILGVRQSVEANSFSFSDSGGTNSNDENNRPRKPFAFVVSGGGF